MVVVVVRRLREGREVGDVLVLRGFGSVEAQRGDGVDGQGLFDVLDLAVEIAVDGLTAGWGRCAAERGRARGDNGSVVAVSHVACRFVPDGRGGGSRWRCHGGWSKRQGSTRRDVVIIS